MSCLHDAIINSAPSVLKYIKKHELFRKFQPWTVEDTNINEIESASFLINVMIGAPVLNIEIEQWGAWSFLTIVIDEVYLCSYYVRSEEYICHTKHAFFYCSHFKPLHQPKFCGVLIDNRAYAPICVLDKNEGVTMLNLKPGLNSFSGGMWDVEYVYKITTC